MPIRRFKTSLFSQNDPYKVMSGRYLQTVSATGGTITNFGGYTIHRFTSTGSSTFSISSSGIHNYEVLIVAGGGSGGGSNNSFTYGGHSGAGGYISLSIPLTPQNYSLSVGTGGTSIAVNTFSDGNNGGNSTFSSYTAIGGGAGAGSSGQNVARSGLNGGSGGGGVYGGSGGNGTVGQGNNGNGGSGASAGGGGGAGSAGQVAQGGAGLLNSITGSAVTYAAGGSPWGSFGGGGNNTGNGNGGGYYISGGSGAGGSGIIIIRYLTKGYIY